ncbi:MAG: MBOAT family protein [Polyangiaceae bacterium]|nr:MBOAT family protein [Polyangiaceae bacterium]
MLFNTLQFAWFFLVAFIVAWALVRLRTLRLIFLFAASYFFYAGWNWRYLPLIFASSTVDYWLGHFISREDDPRKRKLWLTATVVVNLGFLGLFKYWNFGVDMLMAVAAAIGADIPPIYLRLALPVGISFYTFESMSYVIDVYRRTTKPCDSYLKYLLFVAFFPKLVAGPIIRPRDLIPQFEREPVWSDHEAGKALFLIAIGLIKKVVIGDYLALNLVDRVFLQPANYSALEVLAGIYGYAVQIYCDFSGYTDIAIGCAALLGVRFSLNFNSPYKAHNLQEFWHRWHISLSTWLRDYLYIPLGGSKHGPLNTYRNLLITMLLGGLWHGAAWTFVFWGFLHGGLLAVTRLFQRWRADRGPATSTMSAATPPARRHPPEQVPPTAASALLKRLAFLAGVFFTFHYVCLGWVFFRADSFEKAWAILQRLGSLSTFHPNLHPWVLAALVVGMLSHYTPDRAYDWTRERFARLPFWAQGTTLFIVAWAIREAASAEAVPFLYFQF